MRAYFSPWPSASLGAGMRSFYITRSSTTAAYGFGVKCYQEYEVDAHMIAVTVSQVSRSHACCSRCSRGDKAQATCSRRASLAQPFRHT